MNPFRSATGGHSLVGWLAAFGLVATGTALWLGPRNTYQANAAPLPVPELPEAASALPEHLARLEGRHTEILPGTEKLVRIFRGGSARSAWAVVFLHGFSATR